MIIAGAKIIFVSIGIWQPLIKHLSTMICSFLPAHAAAHGEDLCDPDEDVDRVGVDGDGVVDGVVEGHSAVGRVRVLLGAVQDLRE